MLEVHKFSYSTAMKFGYETSEQTKFRSVQHDGAQK